jgi:glycosyltransferase involved in cell wall biosynthesis
MVVYAYYPWAETRVQREAEALVEAGYEVDVLCLREPGEPAFERYRGVDVHRLDVSLNKRSLAHQLLSYVRFTVLAALRLARLGRIHRYDSVQAHNLPDFLVFSAIVPKLHGTPVIVDLHDLMPEFFAGRFGGKGSWLLWLITLQERMSCAFADHVITVSEEWRRTLIGRGVPPEKVSVVMNVADHRIFAPRPPRAPNGQLRLLYHGTVTRRYGLDLAIRAVGLARKDVPGLRLTIRGMGDDMEELRALRSELGLEEAVELIDGFVTGVELPDIIAEADLGVVPYRNDVFTDGLVPTKLMEYAAMGVPSIAARTTTIEEYFAGTMVAFFEPGDSEDLARRVRELATDPTRRSELAKGADAFNERFSWSALGAAYVALVRSLAGPGG